MWGGGGGGGKRVGIQNTMTTLDMCCNILECIH